MKIIRELIDNMEQELDLAKLYAQSFLIYSTENNENKAKRFKIMAYDCLTHADTLRSVAVDMLLTKSFALTKKDEKRIENIGEKYIKNYAWIKHTLKL